MSDGNGQEDTARMLDMVGIANTILDEHRRAAADLGGGWTFVNETRDLPTQALIVSNMRGTWEAVYWVGDGDNPVFTVEAESYEAAIMRCLALALIR